MNLKKYPPFLLAMAAATAAYPIFVIGATIVLTLATFANSYPAHGDLIVLKSTMRSISRGEVIAMNFLTTMFLGLCPYTLTMIGCFVGHMLYQHNQQQKMATIQAESSPSSRSL